MSLTADGTSRIRAAFATTRKADEQKPSATDSANTITSECGSSAQAR